MFMNSGFRVSLLALHRSSIACHFSTLILLLILASCGSSGSNSSAAPPANVGGGFTLLASGGTINDGSGVNGLSVLATLRNSLGQGPVGIWTITITGPGIPATDPITVEYSDPRPGSFMNWKWAGFDPLPGTYRITAANGSTTIYYDFTITADVLPRPAPDASSSGSTITVSWPAVDGAGLYSYEVCSSTWACYNGTTTGTSGIVSFQTLTAGDYLIFVTAEAADRLALSANHTPTPTLVPQRVSEFFFTYPVGTAVNSADYQLKAAGGIMNYDFITASGAVYGLAIWASLENTTTHPDPTPPLGDWNIVVTDPSGFVTNYIYPGGNRHYAYWYYGIEPVAGTYHVLATYGTASTSTTFTVGSWTPSLNPPTGINATKSVNDDITVTWTPVSGAGSYYVSFYCTVWDDVLNQNDYREEWSEWTSAASITIFKSGSTLQQGLQCDVYVSAHEVNMLSAAPPAMSPARADMSENYDGYKLPFVTP